MIFVTVGTHEQQFNRLIKEIDELKQNGTIKEAVFIQIGFSDYIPKYCQYKELISYDEMNEKLRDSRIVITHGGPSSFISVLRYNKIPIVVPRLLTFKEHVNNHQLDFVKDIEFKMNNIIPVYDIKKLGEVINNYDVITKAKGNNLMNNNKIFCQKFEQEIEKLFI